MTIEEELHLLKQSIGGNVGSMAIDITDILAGVKGTSMSLPKNRIQREEIYKTVAEGFQRKHGNFFLEQIFDILETCYPEEVRENETQIIQEIDEWLSNKRNAEFLDEEEGYSYYRLSSR